MQLHSTSVTRVNHIQECGQYSNENSIWEVHGLILSQSKGREKVSQQDQPIARYGQIKYRKLHFLGNSQGCSFSGSTCVTYSSWASIQRKKYYCVDFFRFKCHVEIIKCVKTHSPNKVEK